ncbi:hypothetical protein [Duodenibacillus massiliensis]|uniref:hypothetical protein n=1 Tax=Duodenibacillus massiliensis TaxID=1852381 RepID=UPI003F7EC487
MANVETIVAAYIQVRDQKAELKAKQAEEMKRFDEALDKLEGMALAALQQAGAESLRTPAGTVYQSTRTSATVADKSAFMDYVKDNGAYDLLDVRANKTAVEDFLSQHQDTPPGVVIRREVTVGFRRA